MFKVSARRAIILYPVFTLLLGVVAFRAVEPTIPDIRLVVQAVLVLMGINEALYFTLVTSDVLTVRQIPVAPQAEPMPTAPAGWTPIVKVDGKPHYAFSSEKVQINNERRMAVILWRRHEMEPKAPANLTEAYWVIQKKFFTRKQFATDVMKRWDYNSITYRVNGNKNAARDILDWSRVEEMARGGPLPH